MKAAVLRFLKRPLDLVADIEVPSPAKGQVLVKLAYSGVCRSQLMEIQGHRGIDPYLPHLLGHEGSGRVVSIGEGVTKVKVKELVVLGWIKGSGLDGGGVQYDCSSLNQTINGGGVTTFNEYSLVSENRLVPLPEGIPMDIAVLFGCALPTGAGIITNDIKPKDGSSIAIFGLGGIGMSSLMATQLFNCKEVIAVDISQDKLDLASSFGATHIINSNNANPVDRISEITDGLGVDYAVEASGQVNVIESAFESIRRGGGICVFASHPEEGNKISLDPYELICGKQIREEVGGEIQILIGTFPNSLNYI